MNTNQLVSHIRLSIVSQYQQIAPPYGETDIVEYENLFDVTVDKFVYYYLARISKTIYFKNFSHVFDLYTIPKTGIFQYGHSQVFDEQTIENILDEIDGIHILNLHNNDNQPVYVIIMNGPKSGQIWSLVKNNNNKYIFRKAYDNLLIAVYEQLCKVDIGCIEKLK